VAHDRRVFDHAVLTERLMGDEELAAAIAQTFLEDAPQQLQTLEASLQAGDSASTGMHAHSMKGAAGNIGCEALREVAFEIEKAAAAHDWDAMRRSVPGLKMELARAVQAIRATVAAT